MPLIKVLDLHNCNKNATLTKKSCFTKSQKQRQKGRDPERASRRERSSQRARESARESARVSQRERESEKVRESERKSVVLSASLWLGLPVALCGSIWGSL